MTYPTALKLTDDNRLLITFSDNVTKSYRIRELRDACPCAQRSSAQSFGRPEPAAA